MVLRNPVERFAGSLAQHFANGLEHGKSLPEINSDIDRLTWVDNSFDNMHIWPQFTYLHGIPWNQCEFMTMDQLTELPARVGITDDIQNWNITSDNGAKQAIKRRVQTIITTNPDVSKHVSKYYHTDTEMIQRTLGYIPQK